MDKYCRVLLFFGQSTNSKVFSLMSYINCLSINLYDNNTTYLLVGEHSKKAKDIIIIYIYTYVLPYLYCYSVLH